MKHARALEELWQLALWRRGRAMLEVWCLKIWAIWALSLSVCSKFVFGLLIKNDICPEIEKIRQLDVNARRVQDSEGLPAKGLEATLHHPFTNRIGQLRELINGLISYLLISLSL